MHPWSLRLFPLLLDFRLDESCGGQQVNTRYTLVKSHPRGDGADTHWQKLAGDGAHARIAERVGAMLHGPYSATCPVRSEAKP